MPGQLPNAAHQVRYYGERGEDRLLESKEDADYRCPRCGTPMDHQQKGTTVCWDEFMETFLRTE